MKYEHITEGRFIDRPNRFIAHVEINGQVETVHVKNTGRCRELLVPGTQVFLEKSSNPARKTAYDLICVNKKGRGLINMDSQIPNKAALEWVKAGHLFPEKVQRFLYGSRSEVDRHCRGFWKRKVYNLEFDCKIL